MASRRSLADVVLAVAFVGFGLCEMWWYDGGPEGAVWVTVAAATAYPVALAFRSARPQVMVAWACIVFVAQTMLGGVLTTTLSVVFTSMLIMFSAGFQLPRRRATAWAGVFLLATWLDLAVREDDYYGLLSDLVFTSVIAVGVPFLAGVALRERRHRTEELERLNQALTAERENSARTAVLDERARIAREVHDVVAHSVSLMVVQAGAARRLLTLDVDKSREALLLVESVGRDAMGELRRTLGTMRGELSPSPPSPLPGSADIPTLVARMQSSELIVSLDVHGDPADLSAGADLAAYRLVQEALTNVVRHAGPGPVHATVCLRWTGTALSIIVADDGRGPATAVAAAGHGISGMQERAAAHGGTLVFGPRPTGGFEVAVELPIDQHVSIG